MTISTTEAKEYVKDEIKHQGGLGKSLSNIKLLQKTTLLLSCDQQNIGELRELIEKHTDMLLESIAETPPAQAKMFSMPPTMLCFSLRPPTTPLTPPQQPNLPETERVVWVINKKYKHTIEEKLQDTGWTMVKEYSYPLIGGVQSWTRSQSKNI